VSLAALPAADGGYLLEKPLRFHYLSAERDLVTIRASGAESGQGLLALGGADFDGKPSLSPTPGSRVTVRSESHESRQRGSADLANSGLGAEPSDPKKNHGVPRAAIGQRGVGQLVKTVASHAPGRPIEPDAGPDCNGVKDIRFPPLPATLREVRTSARLWTQPGARFHNELVTVLVGADASEAAFKRQAGGHRMLHLATHGFFVNGACANASEASSDRQLLSLSGFALAGANRNTVSTVRTESLQDDDEDGIVLADEIAALDLSGVDVALLSACETGRGPIEEGEGVRGLRRVFQLAGVRTLILSLWPVDDTSTERWMEAYLKAYLVKRRPLYEAVRDAGLAVLEKERADGRTSHPFFWAAFVAAGGWE